MDPRLRSAPCRPPEESGVVTRLKIAGIDFAAGLCWHYGMADRFINWPPPPEALLPLVKAIARAMAEADFRREQEFLRRGRHLRRSFSPVDPEPEQSVESGAHEEGVAGG